MRLPTVAFACKCDLDRRVEPKDALTLLSRYDVGLIEVTTSKKEVKVGKDGKEVSGSAKIRTAFEWLLKAISSQKG